jgi:hypothetical protein
MRIKSFNNWTPINEERALRTLDTDKEYWIEKGKDGKKVALYTHDDMDGIFCAIEMKKWLEKHKFEIVKYGIVNYSEGWKNTTLDPKLINIALDFANMPGDERDEYIDWYLDHHGAFNPDQEEKYKGAPVKKLATSSAYEALCIVLDLPKDSLRLAAVDMIDAAKYQKYGVSWQRLLDFNLADIKKSENKRLEFAAAFNQFLKRSDHKTLISVIANCKDVSIFGIFNAMKAIYPEHNVDRQGNKKDFVEDSEWRLSTMQKRTRGNDTQKVTIDTFDDFKKLEKGGLVRTSGYVKIGDLVFVPTGTWANALRARAIVEKDFLDGFLDSEPKFILLQYGGTLQVCGYKSMDEMELPTDAEGKPINDLGHYMTGLLKNFQTHLGYYNPDTSIGQDEITVSGGHGGIGSISNIFGTCDVGSYQGLRFIDLFKNKIITDLAGLKGESGEKMGKDERGKMLKFKWSEPKEFTGKEPEMDNKVIGAEDVTKLDKYGKPIQKNESNIMSFKEFK